MDIDKDKLAKTFGVVVREFREKKGYSQEALCLDAEVARSFLSELERGVKLPTLATLFVIAETLGVKASAIIAETESRL